jgi:hypothetical protein
MFNSYGFKGFDSEAYNAWYILFIYFIYFYIVFILFFLYYSIYWFINQKFFLTYLIFLLVVSTSSLNLSTSTFTFFRYCKSAVFYLLNISQLHWLFLHFSSQIALRTPKWKSFTLLLASFILSSFIAVQTVVPLLLILCNLFIYLLKYYSFFTNLVSRLG